MSIYLAIFGKPRYLGLLNLEEPVPRRGAWLVAETMRGIELALLGGPLSLEQEERYRKSCNEDTSDGQVKGGEPALQEITFLRDASEEDIEAVALEREEENIVLLKARELLNNHKLSMKLVDVEFLLDRKKLFFYFTSEQRVDFRAFVRDLAKEFKTRIELRQIGVRDEAKAVKGLAPCGERCCCSYWLHRFTPICIKMVKEQNLALNPTKISGICGRLMCCMSFEHHMYGELWKLLPNPGSKIRTSNGVFLVEGVELSSETVRLRCPDGKEIFVKTEDFSRFKETVMEGKLWEDRTVKEEPFHPVGKRGGESFGTPRLPYYQERKTLNPERTGTEENFPAEPAPREKEALDKGSEQTKKKKRRRKRKPPQGERSTQSNVLPSGKKESENQRKSEDGKGAQRQEGQTHRSNSRRRRPPREGNESLSPRKE